MSSLWWPASILGPADPKCIKYHTSHHIILTTQENVHQLLQISMRGDDHQPNSRGSYSHEKDSPLCYGIHHGLIQTYTNRYPLWYIYISPSWWDPQYFILAIIWIQIIQSFGLWTPPKKWKLFNPGKSWVNIVTRWWFQTFFFKPLPGEMIQFDSYFSKGLKPPTR